VRSAIFFVSEEEGRGKLSQQLTEAPDVSRFSLLKYLWLNNNKIKKVTFSPANYILCELYLHNNKLTDITGSLKNVKSLRILTLHNNWLTDVLKTVKEFRNLKFLHTLNLFHNPLALEPDYRLYLIYYVPSLQNLDQRGIDQQEREASVALCNPDRVRVRQSLAFGTNAVVEVIAQYQPKRKIRPCPSHYNIGMAQVKFPPDKELSSEIMKRSIMQFSCIDWKKMPTAKQKRVERIPTLSPQKITVQFR
uniref:Leucine-rich repeat-containing protein 72 n=1 Tax=Callorhinchus milii TaxID=7868 RepID=A0A4W3HEI1_CALMI